MQDISSLPPLSDCLWVQPCFFMAISFSPVRMLFAPRVDFFLRRTASARSTFCSLHGNSNRFHIFFTPSRQIEMLFLSQPISSISLYMNVRQSFYIGNRKVVIFPVIRLQRALDTVSYTHLDVYKRQHIGRDNFTGVCVNNSGSIAGPVHLHNLTRLVVQVHGSVDLCQIVGIVLVELG